MATKKSDPYAFILAAVSNDQARLNLSRPFVRSLPEGLCLVATDGHRLHVLRVVALDSRADISEGQQVLLVDGTIAPVTGSGQTPDVAKVIPRGPGAVTHTVETEILRQLSNCGPKITHKSKVLLEVSADRICVVGNYFKHSKSVVYLQPRYVGDARIGLDTADVEIVTRGPLDPVIVRGAGQEGRYAAIMPFR